MIPLAFIVACGGSGTRMGGAIPKQFLSLNSEAVLLHTIKRLNRYAPKAQIVVVLPESEHRRWSDICKNAGYNFIGTVVSGGNTRFESVKRGLAVLPSCSYVAIHDGVRPLFTQKMITEGLECVKRHKAAIPIVPLTDSLVQLTGAERNEAISVNRADYGAVQTPQFFDTELLKRAYEQPYSDSFTDDASVVRALGCTVAVFDGSQENIKITHPIDMVLAEYLIKERV